MKTNHTRSVRSVLSVLVGAQTLAVGSAFALPSNQQAWKDRKTGVTVFHDELDPAVFWFVPQVRFETADGKTILRPRTLANGNTEYVTRITPYLSEEIRDRIFADLPEIRQQSQLRPVVAKNIGVSLPDFGFKATSEAPAETPAAEADSTEKPDPDFPYRGGGGRGSRDSDTPPPGNQMDIQYLDIPRLVRFQITPEDVSLFEDLLKDSYGVPVAFTISYDGAVRDKYYQISVSCKDLYQELGRFGSTGAGGAARSVYLGASIETAYRNAVQNNLGGIEITSKGDLPAMDEAISQTFTYCFDPADSIAQRVFEDVDNSSNCDDRGGCDDSDENGRRPKVTFKGKYRFKKTFEKNTRQAAVRHVNMADAVSTTVIMSALRENAPIETVPNPPKLTTRTVVAHFANSERKPLDTGMKIENGVQYTLQTSYVLKIRGKAVAIDATVPRLDNFLFYRVGADPWQRLSQYATISSDLVRTGSLQLYVDAEAIRAVLPWKYKSFGNVPDAEFTVKITAKSFVGGKATLAKIR